MSAKAPSRLPSLEADSPVPVFGLLGALEAWLRRPGDAERQALVAAVQTVASTAGAQGAYVEVAADPIAPFSVGWGSLESGLPETPAEAMAPTRELTALGGRIELARVWLDAGPEESTRFLRSLELALSAVWSGAEVGRATARLEALDEATRAISVELDLDRVLQLIVDRVRLLVGARYAALGIVDARGTIERFITSGISAEERARIGAPPRGRGLLGTIIRDGVSLRIGDISGHPDAYGFPPGHPEMRSFLGVPVRIGSQAIGNFYLSDKEAAPEFGAGDQELVEMFALHAGIAIQNARLHQQVQELAVVDERLRISRDLHDGIIQAIYAVALSLEDVPDLIDEDRADAIARLDRAIDRLNTTITDIRTFIVGLGPGLGASLVDALTAVATEITTGSRLDLHVEFDAVESIDGRLSPQATHELIQIAREALSNVARHSGAERASLVLSAEGDVAVLTVADAGRGFDAEIRPGAGHFGLANLHDRAAAVGGELEIDSGPGRGTRIIVRLPLTQSESPAQ
ncbi:MAG TPA: GAF domain-containing sensor histidine kinase [Candidatus Deferrimicrobiaceae bacterium]|nr:GAF domain-containing sensor histidine kinase [Candidatus Deferrimicrobiaceae bacterium]